MGWLTELGKAAAKAAEKPLAKVGIKAAEKSAEGAEKSLGRALSNAAMKEGRYASKASYAKWIESMGSKAVKADSGFKSWEKTLPMSKTGFKTAEHVGGKVTSNAGKAALHSSRPAGEAVVQGIKMGEKVAEETAKKTAVLNKEALKRAAKAGYTEGGKIINKTAGWAGQYAKYTANHPVASFILSSVAYHQITDRTLLPDLMKAMGGEEATKKGLIGVLGETTLGKKVDKQGNEVGMMSNLVDVLLGEGSYDKVRNQMDAIEGEAVGLYQGMKGGVSSIVGEGADIYEAGKDQVGRFFTGNGMVANNNGGYYDPTTSQYPSTSQMMGESFPQGMQGGQGQPGGIAGTMMNGVSQLSHELTGGNVSKMNLASLALSSYMMFGPFGWLGKMGSLMLGGMTMRNINHRQAESQAMQQQMPRYAAAPATAVEQPHLQIEMPAGEAPAIRRSRGI